MKTQNSKSNNTNQVRMHITEIGESFKDKTTTLIEPEFSDDYPFIAREKALSHCERKQSQNLKFKTKIMKKTIPDKILINLIRDLITSYNFKMHTYIQHEIEGYICSDLTPEEKEEGLEADIKEACGDFQTWANDSDLDVYENFYATLQIQNPTLWDVIKDNRSLLWGEIKSFISFVNKYCIDYHIDEKKAIHKLITKIKLEKLMDL